MEIRPDAWLDFSEYGYEFLLVQAPAASYVILSGVAADHRVAAKLAGMSPIPNRADAVMVRVASGAAANGVVNAVRRHFPLAKARAFDAIVDFADRSGNATASARPWTVVGMNRVGMTVYDDGERRMAVKGGAKSVEGEGNGEPDLFLRATDRAGLVRCAEGFLRGMSGDEGGGVDEKAFLSKVCGDAGTRRSLRPHVGAAFREAFDLLAGTVRSRTTRDAFSLAVRVTESSPAGQAAEGVTPALSIALQKAVGFDGSFEEGGFSASASLGNLSALRPVDVGDAALEAADRSILDLRDSASSGEAFGRLTRFLSDRREDARTLILMPVASSDRDAAGEETSRFRLACDYDFSFDYELDGALAPDAVPFRVLSVGIRRERSVPEAIAPTRNAISSWGEVWTMAAEMSVASELVVRDVVDAEALREQSTTDYALYRPLSVVGSPSKFVPKALQSASIEALERLRGEIGDVDAFFRKELRYGPQEDVASMYSCEQVDAIVMAIVAERRGRGMLVADGAGVGKGRALAGLMRWRALNGSRCVFLTESPKNLSDIWKDIRATRSDGILKPTILNSDVAIIDPLTNEVLLRSDKAQVEDFVRRQEWPAGVNLVIGTYSQFNRDIEKSVPRELVGAPESITYLPAGDRALGMKAVWINQVADSTMRLFLDEAHNAAGDSNISVNLLRPLETVGGVVYSSATHAADEDNLPFFHRLFPSDVSVDDLRVMARQGGAPFKEVVTDMLVRDGVMVRREIDPSSMEHRIVFDEARFDRNLAYMDRLAPILADFVELGRLGDRYAAMTNSRRGASRSDDFFLTKRGFGAPLNYISRLFVSALRTEAVIEQSIKMLDAGEGKPLIYLDSTLQSLMEDVAMSRPEGEPASLTMRDLLDKVFERAVMVRSRDESEGIDISQVGPDLPTTALVAVSRRHRGEDRENAIEEAAASHTQIHANIRSVCTRLREAIDAFPHLSIAMADDIREGIEAAGYSFVEMTGRSIAIEDGRFVRRRQVDAVAAKNDYNAGVYDVGLIGRGMTTGLDFHASSTFADQRRRFLIEMQTALDIRKRTQTAGRPNRHDQVVPPVRMTVSTGLPAEMRLQAIENAHLRSLSALTSGNRDSALLNRSIPDLINSVGDVVCSRYAEAHPDLMRRMGFEPTVVQARAEENVQEDQKAQDALGRTMGKGRRVANRVDAIVDGPAQVTFGRRTAVEILGRLDMLPVTEQARVADEIIAEFKAVIQEMEAKGETPLRPRELSGVVHEQSRRPVVGMVGDGGSVFNEPVYAMDGAIKKPSGWLTSADLVELIEIGAMSATRRQSCVTRLSTGLHEILNAHVPAGVANVADALEKGVKSVVSRHGKLTALLDVIRRVEPGNEVAFTYDGDVRKGVVTRIAYPKKGREHVVAGYSVEFVVPGDAKASSVSLEALLKDEHFAIAPGLSEGDPQAALDRFDRQAENRLEKIKILNGNVFEAVRLNAVHKMGSLAVYWRADGTVERGLVLTGVNRSFDAIPVEMTSPQLAFDVVRRGEFELTGSADSRDRSLSIRSVDGVTTLQFPAVSSRYRKFWALPIIEQLNADRSKYKTGRFEAVDISEAQLGEVLEACKAAGVRLWAPPMSREFTLSWTSEKLRERNDEPKPGLEVRLAPAA